MHELALIIFHLQISSRPSKHSYVFSKYPKTAKKKKQEKDALQCITYLVPKEMPSWVTFKKLRSFLFINTQDHSNFTIKIVLVREQKKRGCIETKSW